MQTNYQNVEWALLSWVNFQQTLHFLLDSAHSLNAPDLTFQIQRLFDSCPVLFESVLPISECVLGVQDPSEALWGDEHHLNSRTQSQISQADMKDNGLPHHFNILEHDDWRLTALQDAYVRDYGRPNIQLISGISLAWFRQFGFTDRWVVIISTTVSFCPPSNPWNWC